MLSCGDDAGHTWRHVFQPFDRRLPLYEGADRIGAVVFCRENQA